MSAPLQDSAAASPRAASWMPVLAIILLLAAAMGAYVNSLEGPFTFDDFLSIPQNASLHSLSTALSPPSGGETVTGRPILNLSFAVNYALGGEDVWGYHATNLLIHLLAGLTLFGLIRRTLALPRPGTAAPFLEEDDALWVAFAAALLWLVHPLQTESVTYIVQRAESLMSLCYLVTLYAFLRGATGRHPLIWHTVGTVVCLLGMGTKEVMVSAPVMVLLYDRCFLAGGLLPALRRRGWFHLALAMTWVPLAWLVLHTGNRGGSSGFGAGVGFWTYVSTQFEAVTHYLRLIVWPHPLILDYGVQWTQSAREILPHAAIVALLLVATLLAWIRRPALGFLLVLFWALLAPTSLIPGGRQTLAEHRLYLALAPVLVLLLLGLRACLRKQVWLLVGVAALVLSVLTIQRNNDYRSSLAIWRDTVEKRPGNAAAQNNYATLLIGEGSPEEALAHYLEAARLDSSFADAHYNAANVLKQLGRSPEALPYYERALALQSGDPAMHNEYGLALVNTQRLQEAVAQFQTAVRLRPSMANAHHNLARLLAAAERLPEAQTELELALKANPAEPELQDDLGMVFAMQGRVREALPHFEQAVLLTPNKAQAHLNFAMALEEVGRTQEAAAHYEEARRLGPPRPQR